LGRQQRQNGEEDDAAPGEDAKRGREEVSAHRLWLLTVTALDLTIRPAARPVQAFGRGDPAEGWGRGTAPRARVCGGSG
jgi:hypothetical protein